MKHSARSLVLAPASLLACVVMAACTPKAPDTSAAATPSEPAPAAAEAAPATQDGEVYALVTIPVGKQAPADLAGQVSAWKSGGHVDSVVLLQKYGKQLAETGAKSAGFESLAIVAFPNEEGYTQWNAQAVGQLGPDAIVRRADVLAHDAIDNRDAGKAYYAVNHYESLITPEEYKTYTQAYIVPNMANQKDSGVMTAYTMFLERESSGAKAKAVLVKEYVDEAAFGRSEAIKDAHKKVLLVDPEWSRINDTKATMRTDLNETLAKQAAAQ